MQKPIPVLLLAGLLYGTSLSAVAAPPVNNAVPPCDDSAQSKKPGCRIDSDSVNQPPKMPHERGVIVPPEVPAEGLPNQELRRQDPQRPNLPLQDPQRQPPRTAPGEPATVDPATQKPGNNLKN